MPMKALYRFLHINLVFHHKRQLELPQMHLLRIPHNQHLEVNRVLLDKLQVNPQEREQQNKEE